MINALNAGCTPLTKSGIRNNDLSRMNQKVSFGEGFDEADEFEKQAVADDGIINLDGPAEVDEPVFARADSQQEPLIISEKSEPETKFEPVKDSSFSLERALGHFGKGFIAPFKAIIEGGVNTIAATAGIGLAAYYLIKKNPAVGPLLVVAGTVMGAAQSLFGIGKIIRAKDSQSREEAFEGLGNGACTLTLAAMSAKPLVQNAKSAEAVSLQMTKGVEDEAALQLVAKKAAAKINSIPKAVIESFKNIRKYTSSFIDTIDNPKTFINATNIAQGKEVIARPKAALTEGGETIKRSRAPKIRGRASMAQDVLAGRLRLSTGGPTVEVTGGVHSDSPTDRFAPSNN